MNVSPLNDSLDDDIENISKKVKNMTITIEKCKEVDETPYSLKEALYSSRLFNRSDDIETKIGTALDSIKEDLLILSNTENKQNEMFEVLMTLLEELKVYIENALSKIHPMEMDGDPNRGITELGLKLIVLGFLANYKEKKIRIESERSLRNGRIDLFVEYIDEENKVLSSLVIELKYIRIAFLKHDEKITTHSHFKKRQRIWKNANDSLPLKLNDIEDLKDIMLSVNFSVAGIVNQTPPIFVPLSKVFNDAIDQCLVYTQKLVQGDINPITSISNVFSCVIMGVGTRIYYVLSQTF